MKDSYMRVGLSCTDNIKGILMELLAARSITVEESSDTFIVESGCQIPPKKISILFELGNINSLMELLDKLSKSQDDNNSTIIGKSTDENYEVIPFNRVCFFEGRGNNTFCITPAGEFKVKEKLYELEAKLPESKFIRVGKSFIVNIENVKQIIPWFGRRLVLRFADIKTEIEVSKNYTRGFKDFLGM